jgi:hypothetical protein
MMLGKALIGLSFLIVSVKLSACLTYLGNTKLVALPAPQACGR